LQKYGYVRVSTKDQNIDRQMSALTAAGIGKDKIYIDKMSGRDFNRPQYKKLVKRLKPDDELYVKSIDRLGRDYDEIIEQWRFLTKIKDIDIIVLDFPLLDTRKKVNGITGKFISDLVLQILSYVAQVERENTYQRQMEGIREAKSKGIRFGRPRRKIPDNFPEIAEMWRNNLISKRQAARMLNTSHSTFSRWISYDSAANEERK